MRRNKQLIARTIAFALKRRKARQEADAAAALNRGPQNGTD